MTAKPVSSNNFSHGTTGLANRKVAFSAVSEKPILKFKVRIGNEAERKLELSMSRQWEVSWCESVPIDKYGDAELDLAEYVYERFADEATARRVAAERAGESYWGVATLQPFEEITKGDIDSEAVDDWWIEKGKLYGFVGKREDIEA